MGVDTNYLTMQKVSPFSPFNVLTTERFHFFFEYYGSGFHVLNFSGKIILRAEWWCVSEREIALDIECIKNGKYIPSLFLLLLAIGKSEEH